MLMKNSAIALPVPVLDQRTGASVYRIGLRQRDLCNARCDRGEIVGFTGLHVPLRAVGVTTDHGKVGARHLAAMRNSSRDHDRVAARKGDQRTTWTAKLQTSVTAVATEHLVRR